MGTIRSGVGLSSGLNIEQLVGALIEAQKGTVNRLTARAKGFQSIQAGLTTVNANFVSLGLSASTLKSSRTFNARTTTNSDTAQLSVSTSSVAPPGSFQAQVLRKVSTQQLESRGFTDSTQKLGKTGSITIGPGGAVERETSLDLLNQGTGVQRGSIRITDGTGESAVIDLSSAVTAKDVLESINKATSIAVTAEAVGDRFVLRETTGGSLTVTEVEGGQTATALGIKGTSSSGVLYGHNILEVTRDFKLSSLNDGLSFRFHEDGDDVLVELHDGSHFTVELSKAKTLGDVVDAIQEADGNAGKLTVAITDNKLKITDTTTGSKKLVIKDLSGVDVVKGLGIAASTNSSSFTGQRLIGGINSSLLRNLNGGAGIEELGKIRITDRTGAIGFANPGNAHSLSEIVSAINQTVTSSGVKLAVSASINAAGNGIDIVDTSGSTTHDFDIRDSGGTIVEDLGLTQTVSGNVIKSGNLKLQSLSAGTKLSEIAKVEDFSQGSFRIIDSQGNESVINVNETVETVGDLVDRLNSVTGAKISARLNEIGDGFEIIDEAGGTEALQIVEVGGTTAADLGLLKEAKTGTEGKSTIEVRQATIIEIEADDTLTTISQKINDAGGHARSSLVDTGAEVNAFRLQFSSKQEGRAGTLLIDDGGLELGFRTIVEGEDALLRLGTGAGSRLRTSSNNKFLEAASGVTIEALSVGTTPATIDISRDLGVAKKAVKDFVTAFNTIHNTIEAQTAFDPETNTRGALQGNGAVLRISSRLTDLVNKKFGDADQKIRSLFELGITFNAEGQLVLDEDKLQGLLDQDSDAVAEFLQSADTGFGAALDKLVVTLTDKFDGGLTQETKRVADSITSLGSRIDDLNEILEGRRDRLFRQFAQMEESISQLNSSQSAISRLQQISASSTSSRR